MGQVLVPGAGGRHTAVEPIPQTAQDGFRGRWTVRSSALQHGVQVPWGKLIGLLVKLQVYQVSVELSPFVDLSPFEAVLVKQSDS